MESQNGTRNAAAAEGSAQAEAGRLLEALGLTPDLPARLIKRKDGRPVSEIQLGPLGKAEDRPALLQQLELLLKSDVVGAGAWLPVIRQNQLDLQEQASQELRKRLVGRWGQPIRPFLAAIGAGLKQVKSEIDQESVELETRFQQSQAELERWQQDYLRQKDILSRLRTLIESLLHTLVTDSEAIQAWNRRETYGKWRDAYRAASQLLAALIELATRYEHNLELLAASARQALAQVRDDAEQLAERLAGAGPWTYQPDYPVVADLLGQGADVTLQLAQLIVQADEADAGALVRQSAELVARELRRKLDSFGVVQAIELEGRDPELARAVEGTPDALLGVGQYLADQTTEAPLWRLAPGARPRREALQITPGGAALFESDDVSTSSYPGHDDILGFCVVESHVSMNDLLTVQEADTEFRAARAAREYFVVEEVIKEWEAREQQPAAPAPPFPPVPVPLLPEDGRRAGTA